MTSTIALLYEEIVAQTQNGVAKWRQLPKNANAELIFHSERVREQYELEWQQDGSSSTLLMIEKRHREIEHPLLGPTEIKKYELLIVVGGRLVRILDEWAFSWPQLCRLAAAVRHNSTSRSEPIPAPA
jgi:hypothetical protein